MSMRTVLTAAAAATFAVGTATTVLADPDRFPQVRDLAPGIADILQQGTGPAASVCADPAPVQINLSGGLVHVPYHGDVPALIVEGTVTNHGPGAVMATSRALTARLTIRWGDDSTLLASLPLGGLGVNEMRSFTGAVLATDYEALYAVHGAPLVLLHVDADQVDCNTAGPSNTKGEYGPAPTAI